MSEEIKNIIALKQRAEEMLKNDYSRKIGDEEIYTIICEWEKTLDLYNKEKEKNKNLLLQLKDSEKELLEVTKNIISKDKMREKIKELTEITIDPQCDKNVFYKIEVLKSLLEE